MPSVKKRVVTVTYPEFFRETDFHSGFEGGTVMPAMGTWQSPGGKLQGFITLKSLTFD